MFGVYKLGRRSFDDLNIKEDGLLAPKDLSLNFRYYECDKSTTWRAKSFSDGTQVILDGKVTKLFSEDSFDRENQLDSIYKLYIKLGDEFYKYCDGLFFIAIYDENTQKLKLFNSRYNTHRVYYYQNDDFFVFAKEIKSILKYFYHEPLAHLGSVKSFISNGFTIPDQTQIRGIKKLLPTYMLFVEKDGSSISHHWHEEFDFKERSFQNLDEHLDQYEKIYRQGLKEHFETYQSEEVGTLLSGGHDTSFVHIQASQVHHRPIHTFTAAFPNWAWDESKKAENISKKFGGVHHNIPIEAGDLDSIIDIIRTNQEPVVSVTLPIHKIAKISAEYTDTMLGGDGGDTLWGEYYPVAEYHRYMKYLPRFLREFSYHGAKGLRKLTDWERFWELEHVASLFRQDNFYEDFLRRLCTYRHFDDGVQQKLFNKELFSDVSAQRSSLELEFNKNNFEQRLIEAKLFNGFYTYMSFFTYNSMEKFGQNLYFPTINKELMTFITSLPKNWVNGGSTFHRLTNNKKINRKFHKKALQRYLGKDEIYNRSFDMPWYLILRPRHEVLRRLKKRLCDRGWYNTDYIEELFSEFQLQRVKEHELLELKHHGYRIYTLLALEIWCMEFLDGGIHRELSKDISLEEYLR